MTVSYTHLDVYKRQVLKRVVVGRDRPRHGAISRNRRLRGVSPRRGLAFPGLRVREARGLSILGGAVGAHDPAGQPVVNRHVGILSRLGDLLINCLLYTSRCV